MKALKEYIESGILELYVLGLTQADETAEVEAMMEAHAEIRKEVEEIRAALHTYSQTQVSAPHPAVKAMISATIDYTERLENGEQVSFPTELNEQSLVSNYHEWLNREDMIQEKNGENIFAKIIGHTEKQTTVILWINDFVPEEMHEDVYEKFLIVEGTCDIITPDKTYSLVAGDYFCVPLHCKHKVQVTSSVPCKAILQRVAA